MVDSGYDFLTPELLNLIFFQQKSVVIFPYVDQKHLKLLETFCIGHSIVDLDCTTLDDVVSIVEFESGTYSQNPNLYFVYNATKDIITSLSERENVHCIVNTHEDVSQLAKGQNLVFYNKKNKKFLNWDFDSQDLSFENELLGQSNGNALILQDALINMKAIATRVYTAIVEEGSIQSIPVLFSEHASKYHSTHWSRILEFMGNHYKIETPPEVIKKVQEARVYGNRGSITKTRTRAPLADFSSEYELIITVDRAISNAFVQALHEYRSKHVNSANLEISQLYNPKELYNYLRNHHWKNGIDEQFVKEWFHNNDLITKENMNDVKVMSKKLNLSNLIEFHKGTETIENEDIVGESESRRVSEGAHFRPQNSMPSIHDFREFKAWIREKIAFLEKQLGD